MAELESMKYFSAEYLEADSTLNQPAQESVPVKLASANEAGIGEWTVGLTIVTVFFSIAGVWGVFGGLYDLFCAVNLEMTLATYEKFSGITDLSMHIEVIQNQIDNRWLLFVVGGLRVLVGASFLVAAGMLKSCKEDANRIAALACVGSVFYCMMLTASSWFFMPDMSTMQGMTEEALAVANTVAAVVVVLPFIFAMVFYGGLIAYLMNKNNRRFFGPRESSLGASFS